MNKITRKAHIERLRLIAWLRWLEFELKPVGSTELQKIARRYVSAKAELDQALLKDCEAQMNRRVL